MLNEKKKIKSKAALSIYLFAVIFAPPITPQFNLLVALCSGVWLAVCNSINIRYYLQKTGLLALGGFCIYLIHIVFQRIISYVIFDDAVNSSHYISLYNRIIVLLIVMLPCSITFVNGARRKGLTLNDMIEVIIWAGILETITCVLAFAFPDIKMFFNNLALMNTGEEFNKWYITVRSYGFARTLVDVYGWGTGITAGISLIYGVYVKKEYIFYSVFLLIAPLLNARTGLVIYALALGIISVFVVVRLEIKKIGRIFFTAMAIVALYFLFWPIAEKNYPMTINWIEEGIEDFVHLLFSEKDLKVTGFAKTLQVKNSWMLPEYPRILFGTGHSRYEALGYMHTDFGYVNDIWAGGMIGVIFLYGSLAYFSIKNIKKVSGAYYLILIYTLFSFFIFNIKACAVGYNPGTAIYILIVCAINFNTAQQNDLAAAMLRRMKFMPVRYSQIWYIQNTEQK